MLRSKCICQLCAKFDRVTFFFINLCGFDPALTNLIVQVLPLVFEAVYDVKKDQNKDIRTCPVITCAKEIFCGTNLFVTEFASSFSAYIPSMQIGWQKDNKEAGILKTDFKSKFILTKQNILAFTPLTLQFMLDYPC